MLQIERELRDPDRLPEWVAVARQGVSPLRVAACIERLLLEGVPAEALDRLEAATDGRSAASDEVVGLVRRLVGQLSDRLKLEQLLTFGLLVTLAVQLLRRNGRAAQELRDRFQLLLIDEFQDTDEQQCELIHCLALEGVNAPSLLIVGDPKQSIYGWRSADLAAYQRFAAQLVRRGALRYQLSANFRSTSIILEEVDRLIAPLMRYQAGVQPYYQRLFKPDDRLIGGNQATPVEQAAEASIVDATDTDSSVEYWVSWAALPGNDLAPGSLGDAQRHVGPLTRASEARQLEAAAIADEIQRGREKRPGEQIAILLRASTYRHVYLAALEARGIPYDADFSPSEAHGAEVTEAIALLRTALDPTDDLALVGWLRSTVVALPDAVLEPLVEHGVLKQLQLASDATDLAARLAPAVEAAQQRLQEVGPEAPAQLQGWADALLWGCSVVYRVRKLACQADWVTFVESLRQESQVEVVHAGGPHGAAAAGRLDRLFAWVTDQLVDRGGSISR